MSFKRFTRKNLLLGTEDYLPAKVPPLEKPYRKLKIVSSQYAANQATTLTVPSLKSRNNRDILLVDTEWITGYRYFVLENTRLLDTVENLTVNYMDMTVVRSEYLS